MANEVISVRVEPDLKSEVIKILDKLGVSLSQAVKMFLNQIKLKKSIPLELDLEKMPVLSKREIIELGKSYQDLVKGNYYPLDPNSSASVRKLLGKKWTNIS